MKRNDNDNNNNFFGIWQHEFAVTPDNISTEYRCVMRIAKFGNDNEIKLKFLKPIKKQYDGWFKCKMIGKNCFACTHSFGHVYFTYLEQSNRLVEVNLDDEVIVKWCKLKKSTRF